jgi:autotransporter-associated beta strand protein
MKTKNTNSNRWFIAAKPCQKPTRSQKTDIKINYRRNNLLAAAAVFALLVNQATAGIFTWTGASSGIWSGAGNWTGGVPAVANTSDVIISGTVNVGGMYAGGQSYTVRSLTFDDTNDAYTSLSLSATLNPGSGSRTLTFSSDSGNATLSVAAGSTGDKIINRVGTGTSSVILTSSLDINHNGSGTVIFGTQSVITGAGGINKSGTGTLTLSGANTYTGNTLVSAGKIVLGNALALQNSAYDTASVDGGLDVTGYPTPTLGGLTGSTNLTSTLITGYGSISTLTLNPQTGITNTYSGDVGNGNGSMALTKTGAGTQVLSGTNTYTGGTMIIGGTLQIGNGGSTGSIAPTSAIANYGTLAFNRTGISTLISAITGSGALTFSGGGTNTLASSTGALSSGGITVGSATTLTIAAGGGSATRTVANAITLNGGTLQGGVSDIPTVSILSGAGTSSSFVDANGVTIILKGSGTANTTANLTLASGVTVTGANQLLVGGGGGGGSSRASRRDGGGGGGGFTVLTTGNLSGTLALTAGGGGTGALNGGIGTAGNASSIGATQASGGTMAAASAGTPTGNGGNSSKTIGGDHEASGAQRGGVFQGNVGVAQDERDDGRVP